MKDHYDINREPVSYSFLGFGDAVTINTVKKMIDTIKSSSKNLRVVKKAADIVSHLPAKDQVAEVTTIYNWVRDNSRYVKDPHGTEMLQSPLVALDQIEAGQVFSGDCDCLVTLTLSLLKSIGYPVALRIASYKPDKIHSHVYGLVNIYGQWTPIEPIKEHVPLGWEAPGATDVKDYPVR